MEMNRRALYNSLRMNWILDPSLEVKTWQVEDYRAMPLDNLFERLEDFDIRLDKYSFVAFADSFEDAEDLTESLVNDSSEDVDIQDQIYLMVFELWRRLLPEKQSLAILCDELDHQIHLYDQGGLTNSEGVIDALANLQVILDENVDDGADPQQVFEYINSGCANDIESFLHDFISEKIDNCNYSYANELLEGFSVYLSDIKWFEFLRARLVALNDPDEAVKIVKELIDSKNRDQDLEFNFEVLSFLVPIGDRETFERLIKETAQLLQVEDDFQTLISISADFYHRLDKEEIEHALQLLLKEREKINPNKNFDGRNSDFSLFFKILNP